MNNNLKTDSKTLVQCDFDGTVTEQDVSVMLLDEFAKGDWRALNQQYNEGKFTVGQFNERAFGMIKVGRETMLDYIKPRVHLRKGFKDFVNLCHEKDWRLVIVSNGWDFYIEQIFNDNGLSDIEVHASKTKFGPKGVNVQYIGVNGESVDTEFKSGYVDFFLNKGYRIVYIGDGNSDLSPASRCQYVFATGDLLVKCQNNGLICTPFNDFTEVNSILKTW